MSVEQTESAINIEAIALRFTEQDTPRGWKTLDALGVSLHVLKANKGLVYVLSSSHWDLIRQMLKEAKIPYWYKRALSFSKSTLEEPDNWHKG